MYNYEFVIKQKDFKQFPLKIVYEKSTIPVSRHVDPTLIKWLNDNFKNYSVAINLTPNRYPSGVIICFNTKNDLLLCKLKYNKEFLDK